MELIDAGIFTNTKQVTPGVWTGQINTSRVFKVHMQAFQILQFSIIQTMKKAMLRFIQRKNQN